jgi:hypothetical protein
MYHPDQSGRLTLIQERSDWDVRSFHKKDLAKK